MRLIRYLAAPWWVLQLASGAKSFRDNPLIGSRRLNACGLHVARMRIAHRLAWQRRARLAHMIEPADQAAFERDGFVEKRGFLSPETFAQLRAEVMDWRGPAREMVQGDTLTRRMPFGPAARRALPEVRALLADPRWRGLIRYVGSFDAEPATYVQTILPQCRPGPPDPQTSLHADTFHPTVKAWLFLTDVTHEVGALTYVPGSHRLTRERLDWEWKRSIAARDADVLSARGSPRIGPEELSMLGLPPARAFTVPANTLVVADTCGFHGRGPSSGASPRIEIWAYGRRNPFLPWAGLDPARVPGFAPRRTALVWALRDRFQRLFGQPWKDVRDRRPGDGA